MLFGLHHAALRLRRKSSPILLSCLPERNPAEGVILMNASEYARWGLLGYRMCTKNSFILKPRRLFSRGVKHTKNLAPLFLHPVGNDAGKIR